jgi:amidase/aspartyl-tRNA(Asn)/glutamyl-tRNA(Gln) amidotransferase subunit A
MTKLLTSLIIFSLLITAFHSNAQLNEQMTIKVIHQKMKSKELTSTQLVQRYLQRIEEFDDKESGLNSVIQLNKNAIKQAKSLDSYFAKYGFKGPLHGIPILLKDNIDTIDGMANTAGSTALANNYPKNDAFMVKQLKAAGAIILGKTNLSEWANFRSTSSSSGWSALYGQSRNPYDIAFSPCGSSSGSAVAASANFSTVTIGTETDGSIICPAAMNGVVGIKPTLGTVSRDGIIPIAHSQDTAGSIARNVTDAVILLAAMVEIDQQDSVSISSNINYLSHLKLDGVKGKRIGVARNLTGYHQGLDKVFNKAIQTLRQQGAIIIDGTNFDNIQQWGEVEFEVLLYEFKNGLNKYLAKTAEGIPKSLAQLIEYNKKHADIEMKHFGQELFEMAQEKGEITDKTYLDALARAKLLTQEQGIDALLKKHKLDLIIAPSTSPAWKTDWVNGDHSLGSATSAAAISGYPHITVPMGYIKGLPVGLSLFSGKLQEGNLIEVAFGYEQGTKHRHPPKLN